MIILASGSPRRRELLEQMGIEFTVRCQDFTENSDASLPCDYVMDIARQKAMSAQKGTAAEDVIIAADTVVCKDNKIMGKPKSREDAAKMLMELSGAKHTVLTGVCILGAGLDENWYTETGVEFYELSEAEISEYIDSAEPMDKAGAYGIQGRGAYFVRKIDGDFYNVMGLPIAEVCRALKKGRIYK